MQIVKKLLYALNPYKAMQRDESIKNVLDRLHILEEKNNELLALLRVQDERSVCAYTVLNAIMSATNTVDDKIERFQGMYQTDSVLAHEEANSFHVFDHVRRIRNLFPIKTIDSSNHKLVRIGKPDDGGYIMLDDFAEAKVAYSIGIADDVSWDKAFVNVCGADVFQYDHTVNELPEQDVHFHWQQIGLCGVYDEAHPELKTLPMLLKENGHQNEKNIVLKMDIEGAEYEVLSNLSNEVLNQFSQIVIEFHHLTDPTWEKRIADALTRLNETHQLIHVHANNYLPYTMVGGMVLPELLECTYLRKDAYQFKESTRFFPTELDAPNYYRHPDVVLGYWR